MGYPNDANSQEVLDAVEDAALTRLMQEIRDLAPTKRHRLGPDMVNGRRRLTVPAAQQVLTHLGKCPSISAPAPAEPVAQAAVTAQATAGIPPRLADFKGLVPHGYYATPSRTGTNDYDFWRVDDGKDKWDGYAFPVRILGGGDGDSMRTVSLDNMQKRLALQAIVEYGISEAAMLFAAELKRCSDCGLVLTDEESRRYGKGRVCREKKS